MRVTKLEFKHLAVEKEKLRVRIKESYKTQNTRIKALEKALEDLQVIYTYKERLR